MKKRDGEVVEEFICYGYHTIEDGNVIDRYHDTNTGDYTGIFWFEYKDGTTTKRYSKKTAPKWLLELYEMVTGND